MIPHIFSESLSLLSKEMRFLKILFTAKNNQNKPIEKGANNKFIDVIINKQLMIGRSPGEKFIKHKKKHKEKLYQPHRTFYLQQSQKISNAKFELFNLSEENIYDHNKQQKQKQFDSKQIKIQALESWYGEKLEREDLDLDKKQQTHGNQERKKMESKIINRRKNLKSAINLGTNKKKQINQNQVSRTFEKPNELKLKKEKKKSFTKMRKELVQKIITLLPESNADKKKSQNCLQTKEKEKIRKRNPLFERKRKAILVKGNSTRSVNNSYQTMFNMQYKALLPNGFISHRICTTKN